MPKAEHWAWRLAVRGSAGCAAVAVGIGAFTGPTVPPAADSSVWSLFPRLMPLILIAAGLVAATAPAARRVLPTGLLVGASGAMLSLLLAEQRFQVGDVPWWWYGSWITVAGALLALVAGALDSLARDLRAGRAAGAAAAVLIVIPVVRDQEGWVALVYVLAGATAIALVLRWRAGERLPWSFAVLATLVVDLAITGSEFAPLSGAGLCVVLLASLVLRDPTALLASRLVVVTGLLAPTPLVSEGESIPHVLLCLAAATAILAEFYTATSVGPPKPNATTGSSQSDL